MKSRGLDRSDGQLFLFVNKTQKSKSLSKSDGAVAKQINRHAQHFRTRKVEDQRITSARTSSSSARRIALDGWHRRHTAQISSSDESSPISLTNDEATNGSPHHVPTPTPAPAHHASSPSAFPPPTPPSDDQSSPRKRLSVELLTHNYETDPPNHGRHGDKRQSEDEASLELSSRVYRANFTSYDCVDPFGSTPVHITPEIHVVLQYTLRIYSYAGNNYKLAFLPSHVRDTVSQFPIGAVVQRSVYREHHLYSLMAATTARMKHVFAVNPTKEDPQNIGLAASRHLRKELIRSSHSGVVDKQTILDILFLSVNEMQYGRYENVRQHLQVVAKLYHLLDLNVHYDRWVSETAAHVDNQLALSTGRRPILPFNFDPGPMLPERMAILRREAKNMRYYGYPNPASLIVPRAPPGSMGLRDAVADLAATLDVRMGSQFSLGLKIGAFPGKIGTVVSDLVDCIEIAKVVWLSPLAVCYDAEWLCRKSRAILRALLSIAPENHIGPNDLACKCTECIRLCLMILMTHACTMIGFQTAKTNVLRLKESMAYAFKWWCPVVGWAENCVPFNPKPLEPFFHLQAGFVLWCALTGIFSAEALPEEEWFLERAFNVCRYFGYSTYEDLDGHMSRYMYSKSLQERSLRRAVQRLQLFPDRSFWSTV